MTACLILCLEIRKTIRNMGKNVKYLNREWLFNLFLFTLYDPAIIDRYILRKEKPLNITH